MRLSFFFPPSQILPYDLAGGGHRKGCDEFDQARIFVRCKTMPDKVFNLFFYPPFVNKRPRVRSGVSCGDRFASVAEIADDLFRCWWVKPITLLAVVFRSCQGKRGEQNF
jgi:hypothetical protein